MATPLKLERYTASSKAEDAVLADLLFSLGLISAREQTVEIALELFDIAQQYGFPLVCDGSSSKPLRLDESLRLHDRCVAPWSSWRAQMTLFQFFMNRLQ